MAINTVQISQAARLTGLPVKTLRYYEDIGLVAPERTENGYRQYDSGKIDRLHFIVKAKQLGFTLDEISDVMALKDDDTEPCGHVATMIDSRLEEIEIRIKNLAELRVELTAVRESHRDELAGPCRGTICHLIQGPESPMAE